MNVSKSIFGAPRDFNAVHKLQQRLGSLQQQLATGEKASSLSEMGQQRSFSMTVRARQSRIEAYEANITSVHLRLDFLDKGLGRMNKIESEARSTVSPGGYGSNNINLVTAPDIAKGRLDEVMSILNTDIAGRYVFGGNVTDQKPTENLNDILNGRNGMAGFRAVADERRLADAGTAGNGRIDVTHPAYPLDRHVLIKEQGEHGFGIKIQPANVARGPSSVEIFDGPASVPPSGDELYVRFKAVPNPGDAIALKIRLPDGSERNIELVAWAPPPANPPVIKPGDKTSYFMIGETPVDNAASFAAALGARMQEEAKTELAAASVYAAADNFFRASGPVDRVDRGVPPVPVEQATAMVSDPVGTLRWYHGRTDAGARDSVTSQVDDTTKVRYGVQANEGGILRVVKALAALTVESYPPGQVHSKGKFDAMAARQMERLGEDPIGGGGSIEVIELELGVARSTLGNVEQRHKSYNVQLDTMLAQLEHAPMEEVAMNLVNTKTRLEASFQTMAQISRLSLVNFLP